MYRALLLTLGIGLFATSELRADLGPPKGFKTVVVDHKITTEKEYSDYLFFKIVGVGNGGTVTPVKFGPKTPIELPNPGKNAFFHTATIVAVPKDTLKKYNTEKSFHEALVNGKAEGLLRTKTRLDGAELVKDADKRTTIVREHKMTSVNVKDGIVLTTKDTEPKKKDGGKDSPEDEDDAPGATAYTPRGGVWMAGGAAAFAVMLGGLWVAGRTRRRS